MQSKNKDWFKRSDYFRNWSRVLIRGGGDYTHQVEIQLTPVNDNFTEWLETSVVMVHRHNVTHSAFKDGNLWTHELPEEIADKMNEYLSKEIVNLLLHADIYPMIDWNKFSKNNSETCPLARCMVSKTWFFEISSIDTGISQSFPTETQYLLKTNTIIPQSHISIGGITHTHNGSTFSLNGTYDVSSEYVTIELKFNDGGSEVGTRFNGRVSTSFFNRINDRVKEIYTKKGFPQSVYDSTDSFISTALANLAIFNNK